MLASLSSLWPAMVSPLLAAYCRKQWRERPYTEGYLHGDASLHFSLARSVAHKIFTLSFVFKMVISIIVLNDILRCDTNKNSLFSFFFKGGYWPHPALTASLQRVALATLSQKIISCM